MGRRNRAKPPLTNCRYSVNVLFRLNYVKREAYADNLQLYVAPQPFVWNKATNEIITRKRHALFHSMRAGEQEACANRLLKKLAARNVFLSAQPAAFGFKFFGVDGMRA